MSEIEVKNVTVALSLMVSETEPVELVQRAITSIENQVNGIFVTVTYKGEHCEHNSPLFSYLQSNPNISVSEYKWNNNFADARNFAFSQIPDSYHFFLWMDSDDVWANTQYLPQIIKDAYINNHTAVFFDYLYMVELDENGGIKNVLVTHKRERLIRNDHTFKWIGKLHETLIEQRQVNVVKVYRPEVQVVHLTTDERAKENLSRNISILETMAQEEQRKDPRTLMYLAKAYFDRAKIGADENQKKIDFDLAQSLFMEFLDLSSSPGIGYKPASGWADERSNAWEYIGEICRIQGRMNYSIQATANSMIEAPHYPMYWLDMAMSYTILNDWNKADFWLERAKTVPVPDTTLISTPRDLKARALEIDYQIAMGKQDLERAEIAAKKLSDLFPNNPEFLNRYQTATKLKSLNKVAQSIVYTARYLSDAGQKEKVQSLLNAIPKEIEHEQFASQIRNQFIAPKMWGKDEIAIFCGPGFEKWSPKSLERGVGGSEGGVIYAARELVKQGYKVTVYGDPREEMGMYDGVEYKMWYEINANDLFNILILWRAIGFVDSKFYAKRCYLWMHDVPNPPDFTEERLKKIDKIFALSQYHRSLFRMAKGADFVEIPDEKFFLTANGIPDGIEDATIERDPYRMIYASSIDRGLSYLLNVWADIKKEVPQANLHVYYGTHVFDFLFKDNPERQAWRSKMLKLMQQDGITYHGRVSHGEIIKEYQKSGIFSYPCDFQEISCVNAMTAQRYGAIPVVPNVYALKETVQYGKKIENCDVTSTAGIELYKQELIEALKNQEWQNQVRPAMIEWAKDKFSWATIAAQWKELFTNGQKA